MSAVDARAGERDRSQLLAVVERYALVVLLVGVGAFFALLPATADTFFTADNLRNVAAGDAVIAIAALALTAPLLTGHFDVSIGSVVGASSLIVAKLVLEADVPVGLALAVAVAAGAAVGFVNGWLIGYLGANSLVITLGAATLLGGLMTFWTDGETLVGLPQGLTDLASGNVAGVPKPVWLLALVAFALAYVVGFTPYGRRLLSVGSNPAAARLVGIRVPRVVLSSFVVSGALAAVAGGLMVARNGAASAQIGPELTLPALAAVFLGAATIKPGQFNVPGTLVGVFFVAVSVNGLTLAGTADWVEPVFNGAAVVIAVSLSTVLARRRGAVPGDA